MCSSSSTTISNEANSGNASVTTTPQLPELSTVANAVLGQDAAANPLELTAGADLLELTAGADLLLG